MTDLHTHILPGMDDGSRDTAMSLAMLRAERDQGIDSVVLTPHFYHDMESPRTFLRRRAEAFDTLRRALDALAPEERDSLPKLSLGAEVAWMPGMSDWPELNELCYEGTNYLLLEPPFTPWSERFLRDLYELLNQRALVPVIAHIDRYVDTQDKKMLRELYSLGLPTQISAEHFLRFATRGKMLRCLRDGVAQLLISDCHNLTSRPPNLGAAMEVIHRKLGDAAMSLFHATDELLTADTWLDD